MKNILLKKYEKKKLLTKTTIILTLSCCVIDLVITFFLFNVPVDNEYFEYCKFLQGPVTEEKTSWVMQEQNRLESIIQSKEKMSNQYLEGTINKDTFDDYNNQYSYAIKRIDSLTRIQNQMSYLNNKSADFSVELIYEDGWNTFLANNIQTYLLSFLILIVLIPYLLKEHESKVQNIINTTSNGISSLRYKFMYASILSIFLATIWMVIHLISAVVMLKLPGLTIPVQSLECFQEIPFSINMIEMVIVVFCLMLMGAETIVCFLFWLSEISKKMIIVTAIYLVNIFLITALKDFIPPALIYTSFIASLSGFQLLVENSIIYIFGLQIPGLFISGALFFLLVALAIVRLKSKK